MSVLPDSEVDAHLESMQTRLDGYKIGSDLDQDMNGADLRER